MSKPVIYFDNDETLQCHAWLSSPVTKSGYRCEHFPTYNPEKPYMVMFIRPGIHDALSTLRKNYEVKMLTMATRTSALNVNKLGDFGFAETDIIAREDLLGTHHLTTEYPQPQKFKVCPNSILIDDQCTFSGHLQCKFRYLGINASKYIRCNPLYPVSKDENIPVELDYTKTLLSDILSLTTELPPL
jgi:hypothetical protein